MQNKEKLELLIYEKFRKRALQQQTDVSRELRKYLKDQEIYRNRTFSYTSLEHLKDVLIESDLLFIGDFHTFNQNIKNVIRLIRGMDQNKRISDSQLIIGLEMIDHHQQHITDAFIEGHLTELEFLKLINYQQSWKFPWLHYREIFMIARDKNIKIIALNSKGSLHRRDLFASNLIEQQFQDSTLKNKKMIVIFGELHLNSDKLPKLVYDKRKNLKQVVIHQNLDSIYFKIPSKKRKSNEDIIVKFKSEFHHLNEFCIISAPPWIKYESMLYWFEHIVDDPDFDIHDYIIENKAIVFHPDIHEQFISIIDFYNQIHLNKLISSNSIQELSFNLYDHRNLDYIEDTISDFKLKSVRNFFKYLILKGDSFYMPLNHSIYCSSFSTSRLNLLAGSFIFFNNNALKHENTLKAFMRNDKESLFFYFVQSFIFSVYFAKTYNPYIKCNLYQDFVNLKKHVKTKTNDKILAYTLDVLNKKEITPDIYSQNLKVIYEISKNIGNLLGHYLFIDVFHAKKISIHLFLEWFEGEISLNHMLSSLLSGNKNYKNHLKRFF